MPNKYISHEQETIDELISMVHKIYKNTDLELNDLMNHELIDNLKKVSKKVQKILVFLENKKIDAILKNATYGDGSICENCNKNSLIQFCKLCSDTNFFKSIG